MKQTWETDRTGLAATLMTEDHQLLELVWRPAPRLPGGYACYFVFAWQPGIEKLATLFERGTMLVEPKRYGQAYHELRQRMRATRPAAQAIAG